MPPQVQATPSSVCDGSASLRLAHWGEPVNASTGQVVLLERGAQNLYVDGHCRAWVRAGEWDELRTLTLGDDDVQRLTAQLRLAEWASLQAAYCVDVTDLGPLAFYYAAKLIVLSGCNNLPAAPFDLWSTMRAQISALFSRGTPVTEGRVRYRLLPYSGPDPQAVRGGQPWPLGNIDQSLAPPAVDGGPAIQMVEGEAATELRQLRARYRAGEIGDYPLFGIPIVETDGRRFSLYARDVSPFEDAEGRITYLEE
jgi:hypothetical protein